MKQLEFANPIFNIYSEDKYVFIEWLTNTLDEEYREGWSQILQLTAAKKVTNWLSDVQRLGAVSERSTAYANEEVIPEMIRLGVKKVAIIVPTDLFDKMITEDSFEKIEWNDTTIYRHFQNLNEAEAWLNGSV